MGATGTIGTAVVAALTSRREVVKVGHHGGDFQVDLVSPDSIARLFRATGSFDALVCTAGAKIMRSEAGYTERAHHE